MANELPFDGFKELIETPLEKKDSKSFNSIKRIFLEERSVQQAPFSTLLLRLSGKEFSNKEAISHWRRILENKNGIEQKIGRNIGIQAAVIDYFDQQNTDESFINPFSATQPETISTKISEEWIEKIYTPGYHLEKLKEEMSRSKRYKHALNCYFIRC